MSSSACSMFALCLSATSLPRRVAGGKRICECGTAAGGARPLNYCGTRRQTVLSTKSLRQLFGNVLCQGPGEKSAGDGILFAGDFFGRAARADAAPLLGRAGTEVDHIVGGPHDL